MVEKKEDTFYSQMDIKPLKDGDKVGKSSQEKHKKFIEERTITKAKAFERVSKQRFGF